MRIIRSAIAVMLVLALFIISGCCEKNTSQQVDAGEGIIINDDVGREVRLVKKPERIVVCSMSFLEPLHLLEGNIVGRPTSQMVPDFAKDISSVGKAVQIDMEKVLALNPDLVIINRGMNEKLIKTLEDNGIPSIVIKARTYEDVKRELRIFGQITNNPEKAEKAINSMNEEIDAVKQQLPKDEKRVAILFSSSQGLNIQLSGSIAGSIAKDFGWKNIADGRLPMEKNPDATPYSLETMVEQNPEIIFVVTMGNAPSLEQELLDEFRNNPAWKTVTAVQKNQIYFLPQETFLINPGLKYPGCYKKMAKFVYPELF